METGPEFSISSYLFTTLNTVAFKDGSAHDVVMETLLSCGAMCEVCLFLSLGSRPEWSPCWTQSDPPVRREPTTGLPTLDPIVQAG